MQSSEGISGLKKWTMARVGIGRTGRSETTEVSLAFRLAHAHARDAVHAVLDADKLKEDLRWTDIPVITVQSQAAERTSYLQRPDLGRMPDAGSIRMLENLSRPSRYDIVFVMADGLSAIAVQQHVGPLLKCLLSELQKEDYAVGPLIIARQARVALGDHIGQILRAKLVVVLIGERPGLSAADSLGAYITFQPQPGTTDEARNCISNIRPEGLSYSIASAKMLYLLKEAIRKGLTGVDLKDDSENEDLSLIH